MTTKHGFYGTRLYNIWRSMKKRCDNPKDNHYHRYGGRGIRYYNRWASAAEFIKWATVNGYADNLELDRIDNDGDYEPSNCRFVPHIVNAQNRIDTIIIELDGITATVAKHADRRGLARSTVYSRIGKGIDPRNALYPATARRSTDETARHCARASTGIVRAGSAPDHVNAACQMQQPHP